jgi:hypothetical protein
MTETGIDEGQHLLSGREMGLDVSAPNLGDWKVKRHFIRTGHKFHIDQSNPALEGGEKRQIIHLQ